MTDPPRDAQERAAANALFEIALVLEAFDRHIESVRTNHDQEPAPGSIAHVEFSGALGQPAMEFGRPVLDAYGFATARMLAASDHLVVLARAIKAPPRPFAPQTLARMAVELAGRAWHLLDPELSAQQRAGRYVTEMLHSYWEASLRGLTVGGGKDPKELSQRLLDWAAAQGLEIGTPERRAPWVSEARPTTTGLLRRMMGEFGAIGYHFLASASHGGISGITDRLVRERAEGSEEDIGARISVSNADIGLVVSWTVIGYCRGLQRLFEIYGWDDDMTREFRRHASSKVDAFSRSSGVYDLIRRKPEDTR